MMVLVMGISFQGRHYDPGASATAPESCRPWRQPQIKVTFLYVALCAWFIVVKRFLYIHLYSRSECHLVQSWYLRVLIGSDLASSGLRDDGEL
jgi:hypothetical protein